MIKTATFVSVWDDNSVVISTSCKVNEKTREVFDIERHDSAVLDELNLC